MDEEQQLIEENEFIEGFIRSLEDIKAGRIKDFK